MVSNETETKFQALRNNVIENYQTLMNESKSTYSKIQSILHQLLPNICQMNRQQLQNSISACNEFMIQDMTNVAFENIFSFFNKEWQIFLNYINPKIVFDAKIRELENELNQARTESNNIIFSEALQHLTFFGKSLANFNFDMFLPEYCPLIFYDGTTKYNSLIQKSKDLSHNYQLYKELLIYIGDFNQISKFIQQDNNMLGTTAPSYFYAFQRCDEILTQLKSSR